MLFDIHTHTQFRLNENIGKLYNVYPQDVESFLIKYPQAFVSSGIHPWFSENVNLELLEKALVHKNVIAIGECGFDKLRGTDLDIQKNLFELQVALSEKHSKPLIVHCVKAWNELITAYTQLKPTQPWIIHGYRANRNIANNLLPYNFYFSIGENFNPEGLNPVPLDRIFCETDESSLLIEEIYRKLSKDLDLHFDTLIAHIEKNVKKILPRLSDLSI